MTDRRVLSWARDEDQAKNRLKGYQNEPDPRAELVGGRWAVTAAKTAKKETR
jgi:hypothetical protein